jgi:hypothetical protein
MKHVKAFSLEDVVFGIIGSGIAVGIIYLLIS